MLTEIVFVTAAYVDLAAADADYVAVRRLISEHRPPTVFDIVTVGRKSSGEQLFGLRLDDDACDSDPAAALAVGLAAAIFPSVGADVPMAWTAGRERVSATAGEVARSLGREVTREIGEHLDASPASLIAAAAVDVESLVAGSLANARAVLVRSASVDLALIERAARSAERAAQAQRRSDA